MKLNMALPCRISVFTEKGNAKIGDLKPVDLFSVLSCDPALRQVAFEVEEKIQAMVSDAQWTPYFTRGFDNGYKIAHARRIN